MVSIQTDKGYFFYIENGEQKLAVPYGLASSAEESDMKNVSYTYTLWVGSNVTECYSLSLTSPKNTSFFKAMMQAAEMDSKQVYIARKEIQLNLYCISIIL